MNLNLKRFDNCNTSKTYFNRNRNLKLVVLVVGGGRTVIYLIEQQQQKRNTEIFF